MDSKQKKQAGDELLDAVIKNAFTEVFQKEMEELEAEAPKYDDKRPQEEYLKIERQAYKKTQRKPVAFWNVSRRIVASILVVLGLGGIVLFCVPEVKASVVDTVIEFFENYVGFDFSSSKTEIKLEAYTLNYFPRDYVLTDSKEMHTYCRYTFSNNDDRIVLHCLNNSLSQISSDDENRTMMPIEITNYVAYALVPEAPDTEITIVWGNEEICFMLKGNLPLKEMVKIARGFQIN